MGDLIKEACVETLDQAVEAEERGADRIELCSNLDLDGLTPSPQLVQQVILAVQIPVMVMIRPRGGDFLYSPHELEVMKRQIRESADSGANGVVLGVLDSQVHVDREATLALCEAADPMPVTFHKAIDQTPDILTEAIRASEIPGISRILTSGGKETAWKGRDWINQMVKLVGSNAIIIAAGRITSQNLDTLLLQLETTEFHGRKIVGDLSGASI